MDRVIVDAGQHVGEPGLRIDVVELGRFMPSAELCRTVPEDASVVALPGTDQPAT